MIRFVILALGVAVLASCGIETVQTLSVPPISYTAQGSPLSMTFTHESSRYQSSAFQGYQFYYKVYPYETGKEFQARLVADVGTLDSGPVSTLTAMGYKALTQSSSVSSKTESDPLVVTDPSDGDVITLDFTDFLAAENQTTDALDEVQPILTVAGTATTTEYVYRTSELNVGTNYLQNFGTLRTDTTKRSDTTAVAATGGQYQIEVFVVAYGVTTSIETITSKPVAWGEINYIPYQQ